MGATKKLGSDPARLTANQALEILTIYAEYAGRAPARDRFMPIYEYHCAACGHDLDALQKLSDAPLKKCPECGKQKLQRLMSAPSFRLKGSGWYETDFKNDSEKKRNLVESGDGGAEKKSDAAVEATAKSDEAKGATAEAKPAAPADGASAEKKKPAEKKPATAARKKTSTNKKTSTKAARSASA